MQSQKLKTAVVGVGYLGRFHAQKYKALETAELIGVFDASAERAEAVARELGVNVLRSLDEVVQKADAVSVASATQSHFEIARMLLASGRHCLVEKPMTVTSTQGRQLCELAEEKHCTLQVGHIERFNPAWTKAEALMRKPIYVQAQRLAPYKPRGVDANVIFDLMIHDIDLVTHLFHSPIRTISAAGGKVVTREHDFVSARLEFQNGGAADLLASRVSPGTERRVRIFESDRVLDADLGQLQLQVSTLRADSQSLKPEDRLGVETISVEKADALNLEIRDFVTSILEKRNVKVSGRDGLSAIEIAEQILALVQAE